MGSSGTFVFGIACVAALGVVAKVVVLASMLAGVTLVYIHTAIGRTCISDGALTVVRSGDIDTIVMYCTLVLTGGTFINIVTTKSISFIATFTSATETADCIGALNIIC